MITEQQVLTLFTEANPVPIDGPAPPIDLAGVETVSEPPPAELMPPRQPVSDARRGGHTGRRGLIAAVASVIVAVAVAVPLVLRSDDSFAAAVGVARSYFEARDRWDGAALQQMFTDDAVIVEYPAGGEPLSADDLPALSEFERALEWRWLLGECDPAAPGAAGTYALSCSYTSENAWTIALDRPQLTSDILFVIEDERITRLEHHVPYGQYEALWATFELWLQEAHPGIVERIIAEPGTGEDRPLLTGDAIAQWGEYSPLFVASVGTQASGDDLAIVENFFAARDRWDGAAIQELLAPDAGAADGRYPLSPTDVARFTEWEQALQWSWTIDGCRDGTASGADVVCTTTSDTLWTRALGRPPITHETQLDIVDGRIASVESDNMSYEFADLWFGFFAWLDDSYPDVLSQMIDGPVPSAGLPILADQALLHDYAMRYATVLESDLATVRSYLEARDRWDGAALTRLFHREATIVLDGSMEMPVADLVALSGFEHVLDWRWSLGECRSAWVDAASLACDVTSDNAWTRALERAPMQGEMVFTIVDGRITRLTAVFPPGEFQTVWDGFAGWLDENRPGAPSRLDHTLGGSDTPRLDAEAVALWREYAPVFLASLDEDVAEP
jgi:hypothetical protein